MGGLLGMLLASQPGSPVRRLVMNDIGAFVPLDALQSIARNLQAPARFDSLEEVEAHLRATHSTWGEISDEQFHALAVHGSRPEGEGFRLHYDPQITRLLRPFPLAPGIFMWDAWYRVRCPVLLLRGETSTIFPQSVAQAMLAAKPDAALIEIPGCGHVPSLMEESQIGIVCNFVRAEADQAQWLRLPSSSSPVSSKTATRSRTRSNASGKRPPAPSPT
jgi:pimeloyl-ACP methyl ester carboxylesterase